MERSLLQGYVPLQTLCEYCSMHELCAKLSGNRADLQPATITRVQLDILSFDLI